MTNDIQLWHQNIYIFDIHAIRFFQLCFSCKFPFTILFPQTLNVIVPFRSRDYASCQCLDHHHVLKYLWCEHWFWAAAGRTLVPSASSLYRNALTGLSSGIRGTKQSASIQGAKSMFSACVRSKISSLATKVFRLRWICCDIAEHFLVVWFDVSITWPNKEINLWNIHVMHDLYLLLIPTVIYSVPQSFYYS